MLVGIDDTDVIDSPGTNQLARAIVCALAADWRCVRITRHQLLEDPRVPCTSKNGCASISLEPIGAPSMDALRETCRRVMREWFVEGSDPGLCITASVPPAVTDFGRRCQNELVKQADARALALAHGLHLEGLGGTEGGVIGALAAVGLGVTGDDGRIVQMGEWPDDLSGVQPVELLRSRDVELREIVSSRPVERGLVEVGKHLRPNLRGGRCVLFVRRREPAPLDPAQETYEAVRLL